MGVYFPSHTDQAEKARECFRLGMRSEWSQKKTTHNFPLILNRTLGRRRRPVVVLCYASEDIILCSTKAANRDSVVAKSKQVTTPNAMGANVYSDFHWLLAGTSNSIQLLQLVRNRWPIKGSVLIILQAWHPLSVWMQRKILSSVTTFSPTSDGISNTISTCGLRLRMHHLIWPRTVLRVSKRKSRTPPKTKLYDARRKAFILSTTCIWMTASTTRVAESTFVLNCTRYKVLFSISQAPLPWTLG